MKQFFVCKEETNLYEFQWRHPRELIGATPLAIGYLPLETNGNDASDAWDASSRTMWWFNSETDARSFAFIMSQKNANATYSYGKVSGGFFSSPSTPKEMKVSEKGVLPA